MSYPVYGEYSPSEIEWVQSIPVAWEECSVKMNFLMQLGKMLQNDPSGLLDIEISYLKALHVNWNHVTTEALPRMWASPSELENYEVKNGDLLVCEGGEVGRAAIISGLEEPAIIQNALHRIRGTSRGNIRYFSYLLRNIADAGWFAILCNKATIAHLTVDKLGAIQMPVPSLAEQQQIAAFLDWKTGQIDALIAKKKELMDKLKEKRLAVITQAVTKGLNPAAPLRDSGITWLGDVPEHWEVKRLKFVARIGNGSTPNREDAAYWDGGVYPWLNSSVVNQETVTSADQFVTPLALAECHLPIVQPPAVLVGITGQGRTRGMASTLLFEATINQHLVYVKPNLSHAIAGFLRRVFDMAYLHLRSESENGGSTKGAITCEQISELPVPVPPLAEQVTIDAYIDLAISKIDRMAEKAESAITHLTEYRTALITAATTGKIDVRSVPIPAHS